jgi:ribosomal protein L11 methylase PrmA
MTEPRVHGASFRDPSGHVFSVEGKLFRSVSPAYAAHYDLLMTSGLYDSLVLGGRLVAHEEVDTAAPANERIYRILEPEVIPFISYPWEWSFSQLKDAALLTLDIAWSALEHGMVLKDASAFNVQFLGTQPIFIDTLSFDTYVEGQQWQAYRQFCEHFLAPLELQARVNPSLSGLLRINLDGVPLGLAARLLPRSTLFRPSTLLHIHSHARAQRAYADSQGQARRATMTKRSLFALVDSLRSAVENCTWSAVGTEWADYYEETNYSDDAALCKIRAVEDFVAQVAPRHVWDLGANTGRYSRIASASGAYTVAFDIDPAAVDRAYRESRGKGEGLLLPLVLDLMNPTPNLGWALSERASFIDRGRPDAVLALALVHHLAIAQNVPLNRVAGFFAEIAPWLLIEFVPKTDSQVRRMLASREDIFPDYSVEGFEQAFSAHFDIEEEHPVWDSERALYTMRRRAL